MSYRFAASKEAIELNSLQEIENSPKGLTLKTDDGTNKAINFAFVWDRISDDTFRLSCFSKVVFNVTNDQFKETIMTHPYSVFNSLLYKELFSVDYIVDPFAKKKDIVYTDEINFKFMEFFEDDEIMSFYISKVVEKFNWSLQIKEDEYSSWENFIL